MNSRDYERLMMERGLVTTPMADQHLVDAMQCQRNFLAVRESDPQLAAIMLERKDRHIRWAIQESWPRESLPMDEKTWLALCETAKKNLEPTVPACNAVPYKTPQNTYQDAYNQMIKERMK